MKLKKICCIAFLGLTGINLLLTLFYDLRFDSVALSRVRVRNHQAAIIWYEVSENIDLSAFPEHTDILLTGEIKNDNYEVDYMLIYPNVCSEQPCMLIGDDPQDAAPSAYWAAKISGGEVTEAWYSKKPLPEEAIRPYEGAQQADQVEFVTLFTSPRKFLQQPWYYDLELIGYYKKSLFTFVLPMQ